MNYNNRKTFNFILRYPFFLIWFRCAYMLLLYVCFVRKRNEVVYKYKIVYTLRFRAFKTPYKQALKTSISHSCLLRSYSHSF